jgi:hypothetical protein
MVTKQLLENEIANLVGLNDMVKSFEEIAVEILLTSKLLC